MIIKITICYFRIVHVRHIEPNWTWSWARFTLVANRNVNAFAVHWTGRVKITTVPKQTEPNRTGIGRNHALSVTTVCIRTAYSIIVILSLLHQGTTQMFT